MNKIIVKRGFEYQKVYYGAGKEVSEEVAKQFPDHVKTLECGEQIGKIVETKEVVEETNEIEIKEPVKKGKKKN
jgi:hypothetical protein